MHPSSPRAAVGISESDDPRTCAVEAAVAARSGLEGESVTFAAVFASAAFADHPEAIIDGIYEAMTPEALIGCVAGGVVGDGTERETGPAVSVWAGSLPKAPRVFHSQLVEGPGAVTLEEPGFLSLEAPGDRRFTGWPAGGRGPYILLVDPFSFPTDVLLKSLEAAEPGAQVMGGLAAGGAGHSRLFMDRQVLDSGAVGVHFDGAAEVIPMVSQGCRPVGRPMTVTGGSRNLVTELAGRPPVERIQEIFQEASEEDQLLMRQGLLVGRVIDERKTDPEVGDFLVRTVLGADPESGAVALGDLVTVGQTIQFHVRDEASAHADLQDRLKRLRDRLPEEPLGALLFTCNGRGSNLFSEQDHDAGLVDREIPNLPVAGFFAGGEIGPVGGRTFLHGFTASMAVLVRASR